MARTFLEGLVGGLQSQIPNILAARQRDEDKKRRRRETIERLRAEYGETALASAAGVESVPALPDDYTEEDIDRSLTDAIIRTAGKASSGRLAGLEGALARNRLSEAEQKRKREAALARANEALLRSDAELIRAGIPSVPSQPLPDDTNIEQANEEYGRAMRTIAETTRLASEGDDARLKMRSLADRVERAEIVTLSDENDFVNQGVAAGLSPDQAREAFGMGYGWRGVGKAKSESVESLKAGLLNLPENLQPKWIGEGDNMFKTKEWLDVARNPVIASNMSTYLKDPATSAYFANASFEDILNDSMNSQKSREMAENIAINRALLLLREDESAFNEKSLGDALAKSWGGDAREKFKLEVQRVNDMSPAQRNIDFARQWKSLTDLSDSDSVSPRTVEVDFGFGNFKKVPLWYFETDKQGNVVPRVIPSDLRTLTKEEKKELEQKKEELEQAKGKTVNVPFSGETSFTIRTGEGKIIDVQYAK